MPSVRVHVCRSNLFFSSPAVAKGLFVRVRQQPLSANNQDRKFLDCCWTPLRETLNSHPRWVVCGFEKTQLHPSLPKSMATQTSCVTTYNAIITRFGAGGEAPFRLAARKPNQMCNRLEHNRIWLASGCWPIAGVKKLVSHVCSCNFADPIKNITTFGLVLLVHAGTGWKIVLPSILPPGNWHHLLVYVFHDSWFMFLARKNSSTFREKLKKGAFSVIALVEIADTSTDKRTHVFE